MANRSIYHPKLVLILISVALTLFFGAEASACPGPTITPVNLNGNDYLSGGVISDTPSGTLDLCGTLNSEAIESGYEVRLSVELSNGATFGAPPSLTVTGGLQWDLFVGGGSGNSSVIWNTSIGNNTIPANQTFTVDISSINVQGPDDVQVTIAVRKADSFSVIDLYRVTATYIDFSPVVSDGDGDGVNDESDNCSTVANSSQTDTDNDGTGDACDNVDDRDSDGDGVLDTSDAFPLDASETTDTDGDGIGDNSDNCVGLANANQSNVDGDVQGDACDNDNDNDGDGVGDNSDVSPNDPNEGLDTDEDGIGDSQDADDDGDGVVDSQDEYPLDSRYSQDTDSDGMPDAWETKNQLDPNDGSDASSDGDDDGLTALSEFTLGTFVNRKDSDRDTLPDGWEVNNGRDPLVADYQVTSGGGHTCALDDNGVQCWGVGFGLSDVPALSNPVQVSAGGHHACSLDDNGVQCWGQNGDGRTDVPALSNPVQVSAGGYHTCSLDDNGVQCWGSNEYGETDVPALSNPVQVSAGGWHSNCALDDNGVQCWGYNEYGETDVPALSNPVQVSAGNGHACALDDNGVQCWGYNGDGRTDVPALSNPVQVSAGGYHTCSIDDNGVQCWGRNGDGQTNVPALSNPTQVSAGLFHTCALDANGVQCWGQNGNGQTGVPDLRIDPDGDFISYENGADAFPFDSAASTDTDGDGKPDEWNPGKTQADSTSTPKLVLDNDDDNDGVNDADDLYPLDASESSDSDGDGVGDNADALPDDPSGTNDTDGDGVGDNSDNCLGLANASQLDHDSDGAGDACDTDDDDDYISDAIEASRGGDPTSLPIYGGSYGLGGTPQKLVDADYAVAAGMHHSCALDGNGVICWGRNNYGQLNVPSLSGPKQISAGDNHTCAFDSVGVKCWGRNDSGQTDVPVSFAQTDGQGYVRGDPKPQNESVSAGANHTCATSRQNVLKCWGSVESGQTRVPVPEPPILEVALDVTVSSPGNTTHFLNVPEGKFDMSVELSGGSGDADLKVTRCYANNCSDSRSTTHDSNSSGTYEVRFYEGSVVPKRYQIDVEQACYSDKSCSSFSNVRLKVEYETIDHGKETLHPYSSWSIDQPQSYLLEVEAGTRDLHFYTVGGSGDVDLQVRSPNGRATYLSDNPDNKEQIFIREPAAGDYTFTLDPNGGSSFDFYISWEPPLSLSFDAHKFDTGGSHTCGFSYDVPRLRCWGSNRDGQISVPSWADSSTVLAVSLGLNHSCALKEDSVECWGDNSYGQSQPVELKQPAGVSAGGSHTCAIDDGDIRCWGSNAKRQLDVPELAGPLAISSGTNHTCALGHGRIVCWGDNTFGQTNVPTLMIDRDGDGVSSQNGEDEFPNDAKESRDSDGDGVGDNADALPNDPNESRDSDGDGIGDNSDNCPELSNANQSNSDGDSEGDACDNDFDNDGIVNSLDDSDGDGVFDDIDTFPLDPTEQVDSDGDGIGDNSDARPNDAQVFAKQYLQTTSASQNITSLHILNTSEREQTFKGTLWGGDGTRQGSWSKPLSDAVPPMGRLTLSSTDLEDIFNIEPWQGPAMLRVQGESSFDLMSKLISPSGLVSNTNCVREDRVLNIEGFDSNNMSYVRLINTSGSDTGEIIGTLYDFEGNAVGNANTVLASNLAPYQQVWVNRNDLANKVGVEWNGEALLEVNQVTGLKLLNLNYITDEETFFNFSCFEDSTSGRVYLQTTSTSQNVSATHLVNTSGVAQQLTGTLYGSDGTRVGSANQPLHSGTIPSKGRIVISSEDIESAFNISPWSGPAMLEVSGSNSFELMTKLTSPSGLISNTNCVRQDQVHNIGGFDQTDMTYVRFINIGDTPISNIRGSMYDPSGNVVGAVNPVLIDELPAKAHVWRNRNQLSDLIGDTWNGTASLKIDNADSNLRLLNLNFINSETFFNFSCYETGQ